MFRQIKGIIGVIPDTVTHRVIEPDSYPDSVRFIADCFISESDDLFVITVND
jgi:hypothetical protein